MKEEPIINNGFDQIFLLGQTNVAFITSGESVNSEWLWPVTGDECNSVSVGSENGESA